MSLILDAWEPLARLLLQALLNSLWQGALIAATGLVFARLSCRLSATTRHAVWFASLLAIGTLPLLSASWQERPAAVAVTVASRGAAPGGSAGAILAQGLKADGAAAKEAAPGAAAELPAPAGPGEAGQSSPDGRRANLSMALLGGRGPLVITSLWLVAAAFGLWRIVKSYFSLIRLSRDLHSLPDALCRRTEEMAAGFRLRRRVRIYASHRVSVPMTVGFIRPLIVLPQELLDDLSRSEFESIVAHELAHIKRWDYLSNICQRLIQSLLFFHPAVWVIGRQLTVERELACDDWAVKITGEPRRYAGCLAKLVESMRGAGPLPVATGMPFGKYIISRRIEMILNNERNSTTSVAKPALFYALGLAGLALIICAYTAPVIAVPLAQRPPRAPDRQERATAPVPVRPPAPVAEEATTPPPPRAAAAPDVVAVPAAPASAAPVAPPVEELSLAAPAEPELAPEPALAPEPFELFTQPALAPPAEAPLAGLTQPVLYWGQQPAPAPRAASESSVAPAISETELLGVLADVVRRDTDPAVRGEALGGIYRFRTDAGINTLIQLYDGLTDLKIKADILSNLLRRTGDNSRAKVKLVAVAKTEKDEELRRIALGQLFRLKGDEGLNSLIEIYDSVPDVKTKQRVIQYLGANKSRKAIDKLIAIAKSDADPIVRQSAIRTLYNIEQRLYLDLIDRGKVGTSSSLFESDRKPGATEGFYFKGQPIPIEGYLAPESSSPKPATFTKEKPRSKGGVR